MKIVSKIRLDSRAKSAKQNVGRLRQQLLSFNPANKQNLKLNNAPDLKSFITSERFTYCRKIYYSCKIMKNELQLGDEGLIF